MNRLPNNCCARLLALLTVIFSAGRALAQSERDTLAATPPIGGNSWNKFACDVSEDLIKSVADAMASNGMEEAGYDGNIVPDPARFPSGIKALADYVHSVVMVKITP